MEIEDGSRANFEYPYVTQTVTIYREEIDRIFELLDMYYDGDAQAMVEGLREARRKMT